MRFIVHIRLCDIEDPVIWRKVAIPMKVTFHSLHLIFQAAMGWENEHLYSFKESKQSRYFNVVSPYTEESGIKASRVSATDVLLSYLNQFPPPELPRDKFYYQYDYGDYWWHEVDVIDFDRSNRVSAELLDGAGACPPENCGGVSGYARVKKYLAGQMPRKEYYNWVTAPDAEKLDVHAFDLDQMRVHVKGWQLLRR